MLCACWEGAVTETSCRPSKLYVSHVLRASQLRGTLKVRRVAMMRAEKCMVQSSHPMWPFTPNHSILKHRLWKIASGETRRCSPAVAAENNDGVALVISTQRYYREVGVPDELVQGAPGDFFELLGLELDADGAQVRAAYRAKQRLVHPDIAGDTATDLAALLNIAYATLMDDVLREAHARQVRLFRKEGGTFDGQPVSLWAGPPGEQRAVFVDEGTCIGCRNCTVCAPDTFQIEDEHGRARVHQQWGDEADAIQEAIETCPVDCIYYVKRKQVALLEFIMKSCPRENIALMARRRSGNLGAAPSSRNPFTRAEHYIKTRQDAKAMMEGSKRPKASSITQDEQLAAAIGRAWLALPHEARLQGWPSWHTECTEA
eukprot:jgi/Botrbrau1/14594/Bobra.242_2s0004.1